MMCTILHSQCRIDCTHIPEKALSHGKTDTTQLPLDDITTRLRNAPFGARVPDDIVHIAFGLDREDVGRHSFTRTAQLARSSPPQEKRIRAAEVSQVEAMASGVAWPREQFGREPSADESAYRAL